MGILDDLKAEEGKLRGIKAPRTQRKGDNLLGGSKKKAPDSDEAKQEKPYD